ncbi:MAG: hypothetical protein ACTMI6_12480, partial [Pseudomonas bubulae]
GFFVGGGLLALFSRGCYCLPVAPLSRARPLPHGVITVLLFDNPSPAHPRLQIVENNIPTLPKRDIKPLQLPVLSSF